MTHRRGSPHPSMQTTPVNEVGKTAAEFPAILKPCRRFSDTNDCGAGYNATLVSKRLPGIHDGQA